MSNLTPFINRVNCELVHDMIEEKKRNLPFTVSNNIVSYIQTDMDNYPYNRFYRGVPYFYNPVIFEREAGFREVHNECYRPLPCPYPSLTPDVKFTSSCTAVLKDNKVISENLSMR